LPELRPSGGRGIRGAAEPDFPAAGLNLEHEVETFERAIILRALDRSGGNRTEAARLLGITFRSMRYRLSKLGISGGDDDDLSSAPSNATPGSQEDDRG
jgi:DNA-binding NtrC family response regulator